MKSRIDIQKARDLLNAFIAGDDSKELNHELERLLENSSFDLDKQAVNRIFEALNVLEWVLDNGLGFDQHFVRLLHQADRAVRAHAGL